MKVILDVTNGYAYIQNADTNGYLEGHIQNKNNPHGVTPSQIGTLTEAQINALVNNGKTKVVRLWQTANWQATFVGDQYLDLGEGNTTSAFDCIVVLCSYSTGYNHISASPLIFATYGGAVVNIQNYPGSNVTRWFRRDGGAAGRYVYVSHGYKNGVEDNTVCIPNQIYGIKW